MKYRPDIDGLRAIAVLFVLFFHSGLALFPSGFIGVDIFFVISGFLITTILHESIQNNQFSFLEFYSRRLWRLQPVFICLLFFTMLLTLLFYLPDDLIQYFKSARKTALFISNSYFARLTKGYFSTNTDQLPLLHTWSLSTEWQGYLILPLGVYFLHRLFNKRYFSQVIYLLTLVFFALTLFFSVKEPTKTYYYLSSRIFEFLIGSCVVFSPKPVFLNKHCLNLINLLAFLSLFYFATANTINSGFPNCYAFILCASVAILISSGKHVPQLLLTQILSVKPLVFIGVLSYSLYIWHWPIFVLLRYWRIEETSPTLLVTFSIIFSLSFFSWYFIEKPAKKFYKMKFSYSFACLFLLPASVIHLSSYLVQKHAGFPKRFEETAQIAAQLEQYHNPQRVLCLDEKNTEINGNCLLGAKNSTSKLGFMFGDSHANHLWGFMDTLAKKANISILAHATAACLSLPGIEQYDWNHQVYTACHEQTKRYYSLIKTNHYDFVIIGQHWDGYLSNKLVVNEPLAKLKKRIEKALHEALDIIIASGAKPVLFKSIIASDSYNCFLNHLKQRKKYNPKHCEFALKAYKSQWQEKLFRDLKNKYPQLIIIDLAKVQCPRGRCKADINGIPLFRDTGHITDYASYQFAASYLKLYTNPFLNFKVL